MKKNKEKYDLNTLNVGWIPQPAKRKLFKIKLKSDNSIIFSKEMTPLETLASAYNAWLEEEYKPTILDDVEKAYLSAVINPFRVKVGYVKKIDCGKREFLKIYLEDDSIPFPFFTKGTMYKGMEADKEYTLKELGL